MKPILPLLSALLLALAPATPAAAQSGRAACYFETSRQALAHGRTMPCSYRFRTNANGRRVVDVTWVDGESSSYIFWNNGVAEIFSRGGRYLGQWLIIDGVTFIFHDSNAVTGLPFPVR